MSEPSQLKLFPMTVPIPLEAIKHLRGFGGLKALYEALCRSGQTEFLPPDNTPIIQLSERNAFYWLEEGCRAFG